MAVGDDAGRSEELDRYVAAFESARGRDPQTDLAQFFPEPEHPLYEEVLVELVRVDLELGWTQRRAKRLEDYRDRFPLLFQHSEVLRALTFEEFRLRRQAGENPTPEEYQLRFGVDLAHWLELPDSSSQGLRNGGLPLLGSRMLASGSVDQPHSSGAPPHESDVSTPKGPELPRSVAAAEDRDAMASWLGRWFGTRGHLQLLKDFRHSDPPTTPDATQNLDSLPAAGMDFVGFHLVAELGRGAFGKVFVARQGALADRPVALKISRDILGESRTLAQLHHTNIVPIYSIHRAGPLHAVCMPFLGSTTLADVLHGLRSQDNLPATAEALAETVNQCKRSTMRGDNLDVPEPSSEALPQPVEVAQPFGSPADRSEKPAGCWKSLEGLSYVQALLWLVARLADGLAHAHERGILHRDLKPANVLLTDDGQPLLLDFNLSEDIKLSAGGSATHIGGTLPYMAPEHIVAFLERKRGVDARSDVYSLGVILYELLTARHPFPLRTGPLHAVLPEIIADRQQAPPEVCRWNPAVTPAVESIVRHCLATEPDRRYQTASQLQEDLRRQLDNLPLRHAPEPSVRERVRKFFRRHPRLLSTTSVAVAAVILIVVLGSLAWVRGREINRTKQIEALRAFRADLDFSRLVLNNPAIDRGELEKGLRRARQAVARFGIVETPQWESSAATALLPPEERARLRDEAAELLLLLARGTRLEARDASDPGKRAELIRAALEFNTRAEECSLQGVNLRAILRQRSNLLRLKDGDNGEARTLLKQAREMPLLTIRDRYFEACELISIGDFRQALSLLGELSRQDPRNEFVWFWLGICHARLGHHERAADHFSTCIALRSDSFWSHYERGRAYLSLKDYEQALADFDRALRLQPDSVPAYLDRAVAKSERKDYAGALADLTHALELPAAPTRIYFMLSRIRAMAGDREKARQERDEGLRHTPADPQSWVARGIARLGGDPKGALADFNEALKLDATYCEAMESKAHVLSERLGRTVEAVAVLDRAVEQHPDYVLARAGRGVLHARLGQREAALADAEAALLLDAQPLIQYQAACIYALTSQENPDDRPEAFRLLAAALRGGFGFDLLDGDDDLKPIRQQPSFRRLVEAARALQAGTIPQPAQR
jgi:serine/threonine protein kinase/tetratricopeptide (TPR) repeat protein